MGKFAMGQPVPRTEDPRLLTGRGKYVGDMTLADQCHGYVLRSPHAHARIVRIDTAAAASMPGVVLILTGKDWAEAGYGHIRPAVPRRRRDGSEMFNPERPALARDRVMMVGDPVAFVVAETVQQARDAAEQISVEYAALPSLTDTARIGKPGAIELWEGCPDNETFFYTLGDKSAVDAAFAKAHHVTTLKVAINRVTAATMEPRCCIGDYDPRDDRYTLYTGLQRPHGTRYDLATRVLKIAETQLRIVSGDVGGSFGMKGGHYPEYVLSLVASKRIGRPVKWVSERTEGMASDDHDRDHISEASLALDKSGSFLGLRVSNVSNIGAFIMPGGMISPTFHLGGLAGTYRTPAIYV
jgi:carbon-monoxide dehydrogenase large subunit